MSRLIQKNFQGCFVDVFMIDRHGNEPCYTNVTINDIDENFIEIKLSSGKIQLLAIREIETIIKK